MLTTAIFLVEKSLIRDGPKFTEYPGRVLGNLTVEKKTTSPPISQLKKSFCPHFFKLKKSPSPHFLRLQKKCWPPYINPQKNFSPPLLPPFEQPQVISISTQYLEKKGSLVISKSLFSLFDNSMDWHGSELLAKRDSLQNLTSKKVAVPLFDKEI